MVQNFSISFPIVIYLMFMANSLGKYLSNTHGIFTNNKFAVFALGFVMYFATNMIAFSPFVWWFDFSLTYFIIIFGIKDGIVIMFLLSRKDKIIFEKWDILITIYLIFVGVLITIIYYFGLTKMIDTKTTNIEIENDILKFKSWSKFEDIVSKSTNMESEFVVNWFGPIVVSIIGLSSITALIFEFAKKHMSIGLVVSFLLVILSIIFTMGISTLNDIGGNFITIFAFLISHNIITYSRRRYGFAFGFALLSAWSFNTYLYLAFLTIAFGTMIIYTIKKLPKTSVFWVQLFSPLLMLSTLWLNRISIFLSIPTLAFTIFSYFFIIGVGRVKLMDKANDFFIKTRYLLPAFIFVILIVASGIVSNSNNYIFLDKQFFGNILLNSFNYVWLQYLQIAIYISIFLMFATICPLWIIQRKNIEKEKIITLMILITIMFIYNPFSNSIIKAIGAIEQFEHLKLLIMILTLIVLYSWAINFEKTKEKKKRQSTVRLIYDSTYNHRAIKF